MPRSAKGLLAIASGSFALGSSEFVMMGVLPLVASGLGTTVPFAGTFISAYALGVCFGTLFLVFGRRVPPRWLLVLFMGIAALGNAMAAVAPNPETLIVARFVSGLPHGAYFGTATIVAKALAKPGEEGRAVSTMVLGQTLANTLGVPGGTLLASALSWRAALAFVAVWALGSLALIARQVPRVSPIRDAGLAGQFEFLRHPAPWLVIGAVFLGNAGTFCWWSYVSPWLERVGGFPGQALPPLLAVAGLGMVFGSVAGGRLSDRLTPGRAAAFGQAVSMVSLVLIFFAAGAGVSSVALMFLCSFGLFFVATPQQVLMVEAGRGGGEMIGSACVQIAFNLGNALGAFVGQRVLDAGASYAWPSLTGVPFSLCAVLLLLAFVLRFERLVRPCPAPTSLRACSLEPASATLAASSESIG